MDFALLLYFIFLFKIFILLIPLTLTLTLTLRGARVRQERVPEFCLLCTIFSINQPIQQFIN